MGHPNSHLVSRGGLAWIEHPLLTRDPWLVHAFSTRRGGVSRGHAAGLNLGLTKGEPQLGVRKNRDLFFQQLGAEHFALASLRQVHSTVIYQVGHAGNRDLEYRLAGRPSASQSGRAQPEGDALLTDQAGILLSVRTADCLAVLLADPKHRAVAAVHAGWRGALGRIIEKTVGEMRRVHGSSPSSLLAVLGPSIRACCYEVGEDVEEAFRGCFANADEFFRNPPGHPPSRAQHYPLSFPNIQPAGHRADPRPSAYLDLIAVAKDQLRSAGLAPRHVAAVDFCTACHPDLFYSYRRDGSGTGRMAAVIGIRPATLH